jgi:3-oxoacyl-[acyl-carrier protein] reductase
VAERPLWSLEGRVALVTGAGRGMGRTHCLELARRGAHISALDLDGDVVEAVADEVRAAGRSALSFAVDVTDREAVETAVERTVDEWDRLDIVVSNAGLINDETLLAETDDDEWRRMLSVNLDGARNLCRAAVPHLKRSGAGRIVIISSQWGQVGPGHSYSYVAAKSALLGFAKNAARELAAHGICVNAITPGSIRTRMVPDPERELELYPIPLGRMAEPEEVSYLVAFLASDEAGFITGQTIPINGGAELVGI